MPPAKREAYDCVPTSQVVPMVAAHRMRAGDKPVVVEASRAREEFSSQEREAAACGQETSLRRERGVSGHELRAYIARAVDHRREQGR